MYTRDVPKQQEVSVLDLEINGVKQARPIYLSHKNGVFSYSVLKYASIVENNYSDPAIDDYKKPFEKIGMEVPKFVEEKLVNDSITIARFPVWIKKYLSRNYQVKINHLKIDLIYVSYNAQKKIVVNRKINLINE